MGKVTSVIALLALLCSPVFSQDVPYHNSDVTTTQDVGAINANFRSLSDQKDILSAGDVPPEYQQCIFSPMFCVNQYDKRITIVDTSLFLSTTTGSVGICFADGTCQTSAGIGSVVVSVNASQMSGDGTIASPLTLLTSSVTLQGNTFNVANSLLKADSAGKLPIANLPTDGYSGTYINVGEQIPGSQVDTSTITAAINFKVAKAGDTMTGGLYGTFASYSSSVTANEFHGPNINRNEGLINTPTIVDSTTAFYVSVGTSSFLIRDNAINDGSGLLYRSIDAAQELAVVAGVQTIYIDWNGGTPIYKVGTEADLNYSDKIPVADIHIRSAGTIKYMLHYGELALGGTAKNTHRVYMLRRFEKDSGLALTESAGRRVLISAGVGWFGSNFSSAEAFDSTTDPMYYYRHGNDGNWFEVSTGSYLNEYYDTPTGTQTLTANRYAVNWIYRDVSGTKEVDIVLGTGDYTLAQAEASQPQTPPASVASFYYPVGRIIVQKGAATATAIEMFGERQLNYSGAMEHNDLLGLQGGAAGQYYHLTSAELTEAQKIPSIILSTGALENSKVNRSGDTMTGSLTVDAGSSGKIVVGYNPIGPVPWTASTITYNGMSSPFMYTDYLSVNSYSVFNSTGIGVFTLSPDAALDVVGEGVFTSSVIAGGFFGSGKGVTDVLQAPATFTIFSQEQIIPSSATGTYLLRVATATYLATAPGNCSSGEFISGLAADGTKTCGAPSGVGGGDVLLASTQTFTGENTFGGTKSTTTFSGWVDIGIEHVMNATTGTSAVATCPTGKRVISCGCFSGSNNIKYCRPMFYFDGTETCQVSTTASDNIGAVAICARIK